MASAISKQGQLRLMIALLIIAAVAAGGGFWYFGYYTKTPEYSLRMIEESVAAHDQKRFARYVDVTHLVNTSSDALFEGLMDAESTLNAPARSAVEGFADIFKAPLRAGFTSVLREFVETGTWGVRAGEDSASSIDADIVLNKVGLKNITFRGIDDIKKNDEDGTAIVSARVFHETAEREFTLLGLLRKTEDGIWRLTEITNFREFIKLIAASRQEQLKKYVDVTDEIIRCHDAAIRGMNQKMLDAMQLGNLGQDKTRAELRRIMTEEILPDWQKRKEELNAVEAPQAAQTLHRLRLHICDMEKSYAKTYTEWLDTKSGATIHRANEMRRDLKEMEAEAERIRGRMRANGF